jgi:hypothetical protein
MRNLFGGLVAVLMAVGPITAARAEITRDEHSYARLD